METFNATLERFFQLKERGTNVRTEVVAGLTTFLAMAYILAVNPSILGNVMDANGVFVATALASALATFLMAFVANYPIALSAGLGLNAYFAFTVCLGELKDVPDPWTIALTAVFVEGCIFILMSFFKFREKIVNGIPQNLKLGITAGIGLFITIIALKGA
ncbi:MAG: NCS2 family permease, partial [Clostridia bacterium]|nr:NCS2 family permease [Clostridia bacterium]